MNKTVKTFVDTYSAHLYSFNWQLYLNSETASVMTEEAMSLFLQGMTFNITELVEHNGHPADDKREKQLQTQLKLYQISYELFLNKKEIVRSEECGHWSRLRPLERSALFLKHKCSLSYKDMENIYHAPAATLISSTHYAREFLLEGRSDLL